MAMIYVKALPGRKIPYEGKIIPNDVFMPVANTTYIRGLMRWPDIEVQGETPPARTAQTSSPKKEPQRPIATGGVTEPPAPGTGAPKPQN